MLAVVLLDDRCELARRTRHAEGEGDTCVVPNSFSDGGGARRRPNVDQSPRRSMKPRPSGALLPEELLDWLAFGDSGSPLAVTVVVCDTPGSTDPKIGVGGLLELGGPRRTGGERPRRIDDGSVASSFVKRSRSRYIFRVTGAEPCTCICDSLAGRPSLSVCPSGVGVVTAVAVVDAGWTDWVEWREVWLTARVRNRDKMDGITPLPIASIRFPSAHY